GVRARNRSRFCTGAIRGKVCKFCNRIRTTSTSNECGVGSTVATRKLPRCNSFAEASKTACVQPDNPFYPRNPRFELKFAPVEDDFAGVARFHQLDGFLELRVREAVCDHW